MTAQHFTPTPTLLQNRRNTRWRRRSRAASIARKLVLDDNADDGALHRLRHCGRARGNDVEIRWDGNKCFVSGVSSCGSIWTCPTCSAKIRTRRANDIEQAASRHAESGGRLCMVTLTIRHDSNDSLEKSLNALIRSWELLTMQRPFKNGLRAHSIGFVRALEITHGSNGWHPHLHILFFLNSDTTDTTTTRLTNSLFESWRDLVTREMGKSPTVERGINLVLFGNDTKTAAHYVSKVAKEVTFANSKSGRDPFEFLDHNTRRHEKLFIEYANATHRKKAISWSLGLKALLLTSDTEDTELAKDDETVGIVCLTITRDLWHTLTTDEKLGWIEFCEAQHVFSSS